MGDDSDESDCVPHKPTGSNQADDENVNVRAAIIHLIGDMI